MKLKINKIFRKQKVSKMGKPYTSVSILADVEGVKDCWINDYDAEYNRSWAEGMEVDINLEKYGEYKGKPTYNVVKPAKANSAEAMSVINNKLDKILELLSKQESVVVSESDSDIPF